MYSDTSRLKKGYRGLNLASNMCNPQREITNKLFGFRIFTDLKALGV